MSKAANKLIAAAAGAGVEDTGDDDFASVVLLLDGDGTSGDDNNTFTDSSTNSYTVTEAGSVTQGSFSPYGDNWSNYFDGSGDQINVPDSNDLDFGTGTFTVELWFYIVSQNHRDGIISKGGTNTGWQLIVSNTNNRIKFIRTTGNATSPQITSGDVDSGEWYHLALTRDSSNDVRLFLNGTQEGTYSDSTSWDTSDDLRIGTNRGQNNDFNGYISNVRVIKGTALYTANFTPPTSPLSAVTNTTLLTCQSNRFIDNSSTAASLTLGGTPKVTPLSPFKDNDARDITTDGGSAYFDGDKSTRLYAGTSNVIPATGDFTVEGWVYFTGVNTVNNRSVFFVKDSGTTAGGDRSFQILLNNDGTNYDDVSVVLFQSNSSFDVSTFTHTFEFNEWYHIAVTRTGKIIECFINGTSKGTDTNSRTSINQSAEENYIGSWRDFAIGPSVAKDDTHIGYFGDFRIVHSRVYTSNFTPPTSPLTAITNTELLLNFQDAGIYDRSGINNINTIGTAQIDTSVVKYGTGSIEFDGNSDYLLGSENPANVLSITDAFTAECWFYQTSTAGTGSSLHALISHWNNSTGNKAFVMGISSTSMILYVSNDGSTNNISGATGGTVSNNVWNHAALTWDGTNYRVFLNGTAVITQANSSSPYASSEVMQIGASKSGSGGSISMFYQGYMDDIRITNGVARYTSSFTPPTAALPKF